MSTPSAVFAAAPSAKLSDAHINAIAGASPTWRFVDEGYAAGGSSKSRVYFRNTGTFNDTLRGFGLNTQAYNYCMAASLSGCGWSSSPAIVDGRIDMGVNDCTRWFVDYGGNPDCYDPDAPAGTRCWSHGNSVCGGLAAHSSRENVALWVRPA